MDLEYRFAHIHSMLCVHVWLVLVRLRAEGKDGKELAQMLHENFQEDVEFRVRAEGVRVLLLLLLLPTSQKSVPGKQGSADHLW